MCQCRIESSDLVTLLGKPGGANGITEGGVFKLLGT